MAFPKIFKRKLKEKKAEKKEIKKKKEDIKVEKPREVESSKPKRQVKIGQAYRFLKALHITEKATDLAGRNQYVFKVYSGANKKEIKKAIEDVYGVDVVSVRMINVPEKKRRLGRIEGWRKGYKKAIIKIKEGQKIEVLPR